MHEDVHSAFAVDDATTMTPHHYHDTTHIPPLAYLRLDGDAALLLDGELVEDLAIVARSLNGTWWWRWRSQALAVSVAVVVSVVSVSVYAQVSVQCQCQCQCQYPQASVQVRACMRASVKVDAGERMDGWVEEDNDEQSFDPCFDR